MKFNLKYYIKHYKVKIIFKHTKPINFIFTIHETLFTIENSKSAGLKFITNRNSI